MRVIKERKNSSFKAVYLPASQAGQKDNMYIVCFFVCVSCMMTKYLSLPVARICFKILAVTSFTALLNIMLIFQAGVIHLASACSVMLYSLVLHLPSEKNQMIGFPAVGAGRLSQAFISSGHCSSQGRTVSLVG